MRSACLVRRSPTAGTFLGEGLAGPARWRQLWPARSATRPFCSLQTLRWGGLRCHASFWFRLFPFATSPRRMNTIGRAAVTSKRP
eukprot:1899175-Rhodomonas_salina.1